MPIKDNDKSNESDRKISINRKITKNRVIEEKEKQLIKPNYSSESIRFVDLYCLTEPSLIDPNHNQDRQLKIIDRKQAMYKNIEGCIVALGSNFLADKHLVQAREHIQSLVKYAKWSTPFVNPDYTAAPHNPKPDYTNQCGYLIFNAPMALIDATQACKKIEQLCKRLIKQDDSHASGRVSIDIDILAIYSTHEWLIIKQRYPFKAHERIGIKELIDEKRKAQQ